MTRPRRRATSSIRTLLTTLVVALVVPLLALGGYLAARTYRAEQAYARGRLLAVAEAAAAGTAQFLRDVEGILDGVAANREIRALDPDRCAAHIAGYRFVLTEVYSNLSAWSSEGTLLCSLYDPPPREQDMARVPGFAEALAASGPTLTPIHRSPRNGRWITVLTYPIEDASGAHAGMVAISVDLVRFQEILAAQHHPPGAIVSLTEIGGAVVARSEGAEALVGSRAPTPSPDSPEDPTRQARGFSRARTPQGVDFIWAFTRVPGTNWVAFAGLPSEQVLGPVAALRIRLALLGIVAAVGALALGLLFYRRITRPLEALVEGIAGAEPGEQALLPTSGPAEIAWVAERFNRAWSARTTAEQERERSDERLRALVEKAVVGIVVTTERGRFLEVNEAAVRLLGYDSREELLALPVERMYASPGERARLLARDAHLETFQGLPRTWLRKDGTPLQVRLSGRRFVLEGGEAAWEMFVEDVSEAARLQAQHAQSQKMEALGRMAGGVAHDFNNLLTVVQGQADMLRSDPTLDPAQKEQAEEIVAAAARGAALNRQLLAFGRRSVSDRRPLDVNDTIRGFELIIRRAAGEDVDVKLVLAPDAGRTLADRGQVEQVLMNLVVNAKDAMPSGGALTLSTRQAMASGEEQAVYPDAKPGPHVVIEVADTGTGIEPSVLPHIFEPFYSTKPTVKGTGLGLAMVYGIVADSGGHIRVRSHVGQGTVIEIWMPLIEAPSPSPGEAADHAPDVRRRGTGVILLVEDEGGVRRLAERVLEHAGYEVLTAADGREALTLAAGYPGKLDLLLTDVVLPGLRGPEVAEALAASGKVGRAVFVSGYPEGLSAAGPAGIRVWKYLQKPFGVNQLLETVEEVLTQES